MKQREKRSKIWKIEKDDLVEIVKSSESIGEILKHFDMNHRGGGNNKTLKQRLDRDDIDYSHIPQGTGSNKGRHRGGSTPIPLKKILIKGSSYTNRNALKKRLFKEGLLEEQCNICDMKNRWNGKPITLQLDHKNGVFNDNRIGNLQILCPNCHSQTLNFAGRNLRRMT